MTIRIDELQEGLNVIENEDTQASVGIDPSVANLVGPVRVKVSLVKTGEEVVIDGTITAEVLDECSRCLTAIRKPLAVPVSIFSSAKRPSVTGIESEEAQPNRYTVFHDGKTLEIGDQIRESVILSLPIRRLCKPDCKGICSGCGADLNAEPCRCRKTQIDERWKPLEKLIHREGGERDGAS